MFVCICNAIRDTELRDAVRRCQPSMNAEGLYNALGRPPQCRQCIEEAEDIIREERSALPPPACDTFAPIAACA